MLVANQLQWLKADTARNPMIGAVTGGLLLLCLLGVWLGVWVYHRGDRKHRQRLDVAPAPDFRGLP